MKNITFLLCFFLFLNAGNDLISQTVLNENESKVFFIYEVEEEPLFLGNNSIIASYLSMSVNDISKEELSIKPFLVTFIIEKNGGVTIDSNSSNYNSSLEGRVMNAIQKMPAWSPGKKAGASVRTKIVLPISPYLIYQSSPLKFIRKKQKFLSFYQGRKSTIVYLQYDNSIRFNSKQNNLLNARGFALGVSDNYHSGFRFNWTLIKVNDNLSPVKNFELKNRIILKSEGRLKAAVIGSSSMDFGYNIFQPIMPDYLNVWPYVSIGCLGASIGNGLDSDYVEFFGFQYGFGINWDILIEGCALKLNLYSLRATNSYPINLIRGFSVSIGITSLMWGKSIK